MKSVPILKCQKGLLTLDFIFASTIVFAFSAILFSFAMTLSVVEVVQYISFATARNYNLGHLNETTQRERAQSKYDQLAGHPAIVPMLSNGWFAIDNVIISDFNDEYQPDADAETFVGARIPFNAPILYKRIPMLGTTASDPEGFRANIQSFLAREPSFQECQEFMSQRAQQMSALGFNFQPNAVAIIMDNGC